MNRTHWIIGLIVLATFLLGAGTMLAQGDTIRVEPENPLCTDTKGGGDPFCTLQAAVDAAEEGDTVEVAAGAVFTQTVNLPAGITLVGNGATIAPPDGHGAMRIFGDPGRMTPVALKITGFSFQTTGEHALVPVDGFPAGLELSLSNNTFVVNQGSATGTQWGVQIDASFMYLSGEISGNSFSGSGGGLHILNPGSFTLRDTRITGNTFHPGLAESLRLSIGSAADLGIEGSVTGNSFGAPVSIAPLSGAPDHTPKVTTGFAGNWWGHQSGPSLAENPGGQGVEFNRANSGAPYTPWVCDHNTGATSCSGGTDPGGGDPDPDPYPGPDPSPTPEPGTHWYLPVVYG
jgi:hypothetical protein